MHSSRLHAHANNNTATGSLFAGSHAGAGITTFLCQNSLCIVQANEAARQVQAQLMMSRLSAAAAGISRTSCNDASSAAERDPLVILCGDFNDSLSSSACQVCQLQHLA